MSDTEPQKEKEQEAIPEEVQETTSPVDTLTQERDDYLDGWQRAKADLANYKKQEDERVGMAITLGLLDLMKDLMRVIDSFDLALTSMEEGKDKEGITAIRAQLLESLKKRAIEQVSVSVGDTFDPEIAEAVAHVPTPDHEEGTIIAVESPGYRLHERIVRPAKVQVSAGAQS